MKLILKQTVANLGEVGQVIDVKPGYGRNYLIPHGLAYEASADNIARLEAEQAKAEEAARRDFLEARRRAAQFEGATLTFTERAGEDGKLFGSVTAADVADWLNQQGELDFELDKRTVQLEDAIKAVGSTTVSVKLHSDVVVEIDVVVEASEG